MTKPMFSDFISQAQDIKESGQWAALNVRIEKLAADPGAGNEWYVQIYGQLCAQVFAEFFALDREFKEARYGDVSLLAWRSRNLLELSIWSHFLAKGRKNARQLYEDAGRDADDLLTVFEKWGQNHGETAEWFELIATAKTDLTNRAAADDIAGLNRRYMRVDKAAEECGLADNYKVMSKVLSKVVHPTAFLILVINDDTQIAQQRELLYGFGCLFFGAAFVVLDNLSTIGLVEPGD